MDCHDVRVLLALQRREGAIDPTERAALQQHLDACPDCASHSHSEQVVDAALGTAMRAVTVPAGLQHRVLTRLAVSRPRRWPRVAAAAAAMLLLVAGGTLWAIPRPTRVDPADVIDLAGRQHMQPAYVEKWFADRGIEMVSWRRANHDDYLWAFDIVVFDGRRVPKLIFVKDEQGTAAVAEVLVLSTKQFDTRDLGEGPINGLLSKVCVERPESDYVYLIITNAPGGPDAFCPVPQ